MFFFIPFLSLSLSLSLMGWKLMRQQLDFLFNFGILFGINEAIALIDSIGIRLGFDWDSINPISSWINGKKRELRIHTPHLHRLTG